MRNVAASLTEYGALHAKRCPHMQANHVLQALLPSGYIEGVGERLSDEDFHRYDEYLFGEDDTGTVSYTHLTLPTILLV